MNSGRSTFNGIPIKTAGDTGTTRAAIANTCDGYPINKGGGGRTNNTVRASVTGAGNLIAQFGLFNGGIIVLIKPIDGSNKLSPFKLN